MYCNNCGAFVPDGSTYCPNCNTVFNTQSQNTNGTYYTPPAADNGYYNQQNFNQQGNYQQGYNQPQGNYYNQNGFADPMNSHKSELESAKTLGIISLVVGIVFSRIIGIILGIIGLSKANSVPDMLDNPMLFKLKKDSVMLNRLGIIIPVVLGVVAIVAYLFFIFVFMADTSTSFM
ncbi:MAG: zinc ribbon domain-containing protein [Eubacterium sp.]|nr:zinc ribbon domain-containing protein [Eubacterium sp.]